MFGWLYLQHVAPHIILQTPAQRVQDVGHLEGQRVIFTAFTAGSYAAHIPDQESRRWRAGQVGFSVGQVRPEPRTEPEPPGRTPAQAEPPPLGQSGTGPGASPRLERNMETTFRKRSMVPHVVSENTGQFVDIGSLQWCRNDMDPPH